MYSLTPSRRRQVVGVHDVQHSYIATVPRIYALRQAGGFRNREQAETLASAVEAVCPILRPLTATLGRG
jgi:hypothetical protein